MQENATKCGFVSAEYRRRTMNRVNLMARKDGIEIPGVGALAMGDTLVLDYDEEDVCVTLGTVEEES
jgi:hypothetical protein